MTCRQSLHADSMCWIWRDVLSHLKIQYFQISSIINCSEWMEKSFSWYQDCVSICSTLLEALNKATGWISRRWKAVSRVSPAWSFVRPPVSFSTVASAFPKISKVYGFPKYSYRHKTLYNFTKTHIEKITIILVYGDSLFLTGSCQKIHKATIQNIGRAHKLRIDDNSSKFWEWLRSPIESDYSYTTILQLKNYWNILECSTVIQL